MKTFFNLIYPICAIIWLWHLGNLFFTDGYAMGWFDQTLSAFTSVMFMITAWIDNMDN